MCFKEEKKFRKIFVVIENFDNLGGIVAFKNKSAQTVKSSREKNITLSKRKPNLAVADYENDFVQPTFEDCHSIGIDRKRYSQFLEKELKVSHKGRKNFKTFFIHFNTNPSSQRIEFENDYE